MYIEKRTQGKNTKYYLTHSYKEGKKTKKIRRYLGQNLSESEISKLKKRAEEIILEQIDELQTEIFNFKLNKNELDKLNKFNDKLKIFHLDAKDWKLFTEEFVYNTNAIEGSTVLQDEVKEILHKNKSSDNPEVIETLGVAKAIKYIKNTTEDLSLDLILKLHKFCFEGSKDFAGKFRGVEVVIKNAFGEIIHAGVPVSDLKSELEEFINWYDENKNEFKPLVLAAIVHNQLEYIHPFQDGNGRVGRLLLNFILIKHDYPPINIKLEDRQEYYNTLREYSINNDLKPTLNFLIKEYDKFKSEVTTKK